MRSSRRKWWQVSQTHTGRGWRPGRAKPMETKSRWEQEREGRQIHWCASSTFCTSHRGHIKNKEKPLPSQSSWARKGGKRLNMGKVPEEEGNN